MGKYIYVINHKSHAKPKMVYWLYIKVVVPIVTYASLIWWYKANNKIAIRKLSKLKILAWE